MDSLCSTCRELNVGSWVDIDPSQTAEAASTLDEIFEPSCPLCALFSYLVSEDDTKTTVAVSFGVHEGTPAWATKGLRDAMDEEHGISKTDRFAYIQDSRGRAVKIYGTPPSETDFSSVKYEALRFWCQKLGGPNRGGGGRGSQDDAELPRRLIDCRERRIVPRPSDPVDYFALSYVWGAAAQPTAAGEEREAGSLPDRLPATVEDAMTVVLRLGFRYLWVDRYCLDQSDKADLQAQLNNMGGIYRHCFSCIVGAAGEDADYGLPGVSKQRPAHQKYGLVKIGDRTLWRSSEYQNRLVSQSAWSTRAWTYQEAIFAPSWLAFTDEQVYFRVPNIELVNQRRWWKDSCELSPGGVDWLSDTAGIEIMLDDVAGNTGAVHTHLSNYTARQLTYQSDAVNAMLGIMRRCGNGPYPLNHYFGVPILGPLINHRKSMARDGSRSWALREAFLVNLCWKAQGGGGSRRAEFPSWSWAGWMTVYERPNFKLCHLGLLADNDVDIGLSVELDGAMMDWEQMCLDRGWDSYEDHQHLPRGLHLKAPTVPLSVHRDPRVSDPSWASSGCHASRLEPMGFCAIFSDDESDVLVEVNLNDAGVEAAVLRDGHVDLKGIILRRRAIQGQWKDFRMNCMMLVVREDDEDGGWLRAGTLELSFNSYAVRWRRDVSHHDVEPRSWPDPKQADCFDCSECLTHAHRVILEGIQDGSTKLV